ncbi:MAG: hypothetical protein DMF51_08300 [Acidobacteria bacterium]|nr:MAG: hypothetical protein DMF51_08300 [Acidobacteriota bacterium]
MTLRVSYLAGNAAWHPLYDVRLDPVTEKVSLSWQAQVSQTTGEDWKDVAVTLATTQPSAGIDLPVLASLELRPVSQASVAASDGEGHPAGRGSVAAREGAALRGPGSGGELDDGGARGR